jgi:hypothetical protein
MPLFSKEFEDFYNENYSFIKSYLVDDHVVKNPVLPQINISISFLKARRFQLLDTSLKKNLLNSDKAFFDVYKIILAHANNYSELIHVLKKYLITIKEDHILQSLLEELPKEKNEKEKSDKLDEDKSLQSILSENVSEAKEDEKERSIDEIKSPSHGDSVADKNIEIKEKDKSSVIENKNKPLSSLASQVDIDDAKEKIISIKYKFFKLNHDEIIFNKIILFKTITRYSQFIKQLPLPDDPVSYPKEGYIKQLTFISEYIKKLTGLVEAINSMFKIALPEKKSIAPMVNQIKNEITFRLSAILSEYKLNDALLSKLLEKEIEESAERIAKQAFYRYLLNDSIKKHIDLDSYYIKGSINVMRKTNTLEKIKDINNYMKQIKQEDIHNKKIVSELNTKLANINIIINEKTVKKIIKTHIALVPSRSSTSSIRLSIESDRSDSLALSAIEEYKSPRVSRGSELSSPSQLISSPLPIKPRPSKSAIQEALKKALAEEAKLKVSALILPIRLGVTPLPLDDEDSEEEGENQDHIFGR